MVWLYHVASQSGKMLETTIEPEWLTRSFWWKHVFAVLNLKFSCPLHFIFAACSAHKQPDQPANQLKANTIEYQSGSCTAFLTYDFSCRSNHLNGACFLLPVRGFVTGLFKCSFACAGLGSRCKSTPGRCVNHVINLQRILQDNYASVLSWFVMICIHAYIHILYILLLFTIEHGLLYSYRIIPGWWLQTFFP